MCKTLAIGNFRWTDNLLRYPESVIKNYAENSDVGCFLEVDIVYSKQLWGHDKDLPFLTEIKKLGNAKKLVTTS